MKIDYRIDEVKPEDFDALFIPGGFSPDILRDDDRFVHLQNRLWMLKNQYLPFVMDHNY